MSASILYFFRFFLKSSIAFEPFNMPKNPLMSPFFSSATSMIISLKLWSAFLRRFRALYAVSVMVIVFTTICLNINIRLFKVFGLLGEKKKEKGLSPFLIEKPLHYSIQC